MAGGVAQAASRKGPGILSRSTSAFPIFHSQMPRPLVSIIIPTYNREASIARTVESALSQSYARTEIVVVDDGSTDGTAAVLSSYGDRIVVVTQENAGPSAARNAGVGECQGELVAFLDSDDLWSPDKIERQVAVMLAARGMAVCCVTNAAFHEDGRIVTTSFRCSCVDVSEEEGYWLNAGDIISSRFLLFNQVVMIWKDVFLKAGGYRQELRILEDHDLAMRLALKGPWAFISEPLVDKINDTAGIGVSAMRDPLLHASSWKKVLDGLLSADLHEFPVIRRRLAASLRDVSIEILAVNLIHGKRAAALGKMLLFFLRAKGALIRRTPLYPRAEVVRSLGADLPNATVPDHSYP